MTKTYFLLLFLLLGFTVSSQNITLKGQIIDQDTKLPLEAATVYLSTVKDSSIVDYTISDKKGNFALPIKKITQPVFLKVSYIGYEEYRQEITRLLADRDFGVLSMHESIKGLNEVVVTSSSSPIRIKKDTLEFNASSFKVRPDSNVEKLLKQLPGIEITPDGKIKFNGKQVDKILVNGKPFFGNDGKIATQNLPADIIGKVQISDTKTKEEELSHQAASSNEKTINLTIREDKNRGLFGKFNTGKGSDDRYEASGMINYFKDKQKFSFLGASNNVNSIGFSMDEIFDSMGGGRNDRSMNSDGSLTIDGQQLGGGAGITQSGLAGVNYADEYGKKLEINGSYLYSNAKTTNDYKSHTERFLTEGGMPDESKSFITESAGSSDRLYEGHRLNLNLEYKIDSLSTLIVRPKLKKNVSYDESAYIQTSANDLGLVNKSSGKSHSGNNDGEFGNELYFYKGFKKKGRFLELIFNNVNSRRHRDTFNDSETFYFQDPDKQDDIRHQRETNVTRSDEYNAGVGYNEPITDSVSVKFRANYNWKNYGVRKATFKRDDVSGHYDFFQDALSYGLQSGVRQFVPSARLNISKKKYTLELTIETQFTDFENSRNYLGGQTILDKNYVFANATAFLNYKLSKFKSILLYYLYDVQMPTVEQLLTVDFTSPLTVIRGEENLKPRKTHSFILNYSDFDFATRSGFIIYCGINYKEKDIVNTSTFDQTNLIDQVSYANIDNSYSGNMSFSILKTIKKEQHKISFDSGIRVNINYNKGLTNDRLYKAFGFSLNPNLGITYEYGEILTIQPSYQYEFNQTDYTNYSIDKSSTFRHVFQTETTLRWPEHIVFGADFGYTYNSNIADGFKKDFYLLNTSIGYSFLKNKLLAKVKVYDILNQNTNTTHTITPEFVSDMQNTVLKRYVMFSLTYKIEKFGGKKESE